MYNRISVCCVVLMLAVAAPLPAAAFTLTINSLTDEEAYFGKADVPPGYGGTATTEKTIDIVWAASISNGTWYINIDSDTNDDTAHEVDNGSGSYGGGTKTFELSASNILEHAEDTSPSGRKAVYVLLLGYDGDGGSTAKLQDTISPVYVYFKMDPPDGVPTITSITAGDANVRVSLDWVSGSTSADKGGFRIGHRVKGAEAYTWTGEFTDTSYKLEGLQNLVEYEIVALQVDKAGNETEPTDPVATTPVPVADYFTYYKLSDGKEEGGFCFIATAAYGSPLHPFVGTLREFRDAYLMTNRPGRWFVDSYYRLSPPAAEAIRHNAAFKFAVGLALLPAVAVAWLLLHPAVPLLAAFISLALRTARRRRMAGVGAGKAALLAICAAGLLLLGPGEASAESPRRFQLEVKFGPFYPNRMDEEKGLVGQPYKDVFGYGVGLLSQVEFDYIFWQKMGSLSIGCTIGYFQVTGRGIAYDPNTGAQYKSMDTTVLNLLPLQLNLVYRFDWPALKKNVPLAPYVKLGLDYDIWWVTNSYGDAPHPELGGEGYGGKWGWHATIGLAFLLNFIDKQTAKDMDVTTGINNIWLFAEWNISRVDNFNSAGFRLGAEWFMFGLMMEM